MKRMLIIFAAAFVISSFALVAVAIAPSSRSRTSKPGADSSCYPKMFGDGTVDFCSYGGPGFDERAAEIIAK